LYEIKLKINNIRNVLIEKFINLCIVKLDTVRKKMAKKRPQ